MNQAPTPAKDVGGAGAFDRFQEFRRRSVAPLMTVLEAEYEQARRSARLRWWWPILQGCALLVATLFGDMIGLAVGLVVTAPLYNPMINYLHSPMRAFERSSKSRLIETICRFYGLTYVDAPDSARISAFREPLVLPEPDHASAKDLISGTHDGTALEIAGVEIHRDIMGESEPIFTGQVMRFSLPRFFAAPLVIWPPGVIEDEGGAPLPDHDRVDLADTAFDETYQVFSADADTARELLDASTRSRLLELADALPERAFTFVNDSLYVADFHVVVVRSKGRLDPMQKLALVTDGFASLFRVLDFIAFIRPARGRPDP